MKIDLDIRDLEDSDGGRYWRVVVVDREEQVHRAIEYRQRDFSGYMMDPARWKHLDFLAGMAEVSRAIADRALDGKSSLDSSPTAP